MLLASEKSNQNCHRMNDFTKRNRNKISKNKLPLSLLLSQNQSRINQNGDRIIHFGYGKFHEKKTTVLRLCSNEVKFIKTTSLQSIYKHSDQLNNENFVAAHFFTAEIYLRIKLKRHFCCCTRKFFFPSKKNDVITSLVSSN